MNNKEAIKILLNSQIYLARHCGKTDMYNAVELAIKALEDRPQGEWITDYESQFFNPGRKCSLCGKIVEFSENYCPNCGAYMRGNNHD